nr:tyrosine--tRNA ligase [Sphingorhabdus sp.]
ALGLAVSKKEARRLISGGGARVDDVQIQDENHMIAAGPEPIKVSAGKKKHGMLHFSA